MPTCLIKAGRAAQLTTVQDWSSETTSSVKGERKENGYSVRDDVVRRADDTLDGMKRDRSTYPSTLFRTLCQKKRFEV